MIKYPILEISNESLYNKRLEHIYFDKSFYHSLFTFRVEKLRERLLKMTFTDAEGQLYKIHDVVCEREYLYWLVIGRYRVDLKLESIDKNIELSELKSVVINKLLINSGEEIFVPDIEKSLTVLEVIESIKLI